LLCFTVLKNQGMSSEEEVRVRVVRELRHRPGLEASCVAVGQVFDEPSARVCVGTASGQVEVFPCSQLTRTEQWAACLTLSTKRASPVVAVLLAGAVSAQAREGSSELVACTQDGHVAVFCDRHVVASFDAHAPLLSAALLPGPRGLSAVATLDLESVVHVFSPPLGPRPLKLTPSLPLSSSSFLPCCLASASLPSLTCPSPSSPSSSPSPLSSCTRRYLLLGGKGVGYAHPSAPHLLAVAPLPSCAHSRVTALASGRLLERGRDGRPGAVIGGSDGKLYELQTVEGLEECGDLGKPPVRLLVPLPLPSGDGDLLVCAGEWSGLLVFDCVRRCVVADISTAAWPVSVAVTVLPDPGTVLLVAILADYSVSCHVLQLDG
ncbi:MAG: hypothetical protein Q8P67_19375, partial [archaeon]|nr:hypothetical protein [archaeon]